MPVGSQLAQVRLASATASTVFTAVLRTELTRVQIVNVTAANETFRLYHDDDGTTYDESTALYWDEAISGNRALQVDIAIEDGGILIDRGGSIGFRPNTNNALTVTIYGVTERLAERPRK